MGCATLKGLVVPIKPIAFMVGPGDGSVPKCLPCECEDPSSYSQNPRKDGTLSICNPSTSKRTWEAETGEPPKLAGLGREKNNRKYLCQTS